MALKPVQKYLPAFPRIYCQIQALITSLLLKLGKFQKNSGLGNKWAFEIKNSLILEIKMPDSQYF
jgi:hypothetical protein